MKLTPLDAAMNKLLYGAPESTNAWNCLEIQKEGSLKGHMSESHLCIDCGFNTSPGCLNRIETEQAIRDLGDKWRSGEGIPMSLSSRDETYMVRDKVWKEAGMIPWGGCLCIGCLEKRLGRRLKPKDFVRGHPFNSAPGTERLLNRRGGYL